MSSKQTKPKNPPKKPISGASKYADDYKEIFWNRVVGGVKNGYIELDLITEETDFQPSIETESMNFKKAKIRRVIHAKALIPIASFQSITTFMQDILQSYPNFFGDITQQQQPKRKKDAKPSVLPSFIG